VMRQYSKLASGVRLPGEALRAASMTGDASGSYPEERGSRPWRRTRE
jgi:hypothetical protein